MYESFFGMQRRPFSATPDPGCFFSCESVQAALDELIVCFERGQGIGILSAPAGMGKTLLCQHLADETSERFEVVYLGNANFPTRRSLLQAILFEIGDEYSRKDEPELRLDLRSRLLSIRPAKEAVVLVIDEAHLFADELLEEVRTLADIAHDGSSLVRVILSAQPELEERLTSRSLDAINQRISNQVYVESLTLTESRDYLAHRLAWAASSLDDVFETEAVNVITRASDGVPRCLNQLADHSLLLAFASDEQPVKRQTVCDALDDLKQLPLHWNDVSTGETVGGWQDDEEDEDETQMPETDIGATDILDAPPRVAIELDGSEPQADGLPGVAAAHDVGNENDDAFEEEEWMPIAPSTPVAVIEFGEPAVADSTNDDDAGSEAERGPEAVTQEQFESDDEAPADMERAESCDNPEAGDSYAELQGLCFEITARGCQFKDDTCQVDESSSVDESTGLVAESADLSDMAIENTAPIEHEHARSVSGADAQETAIHAVAENSGENDAWPDESSDEATASAEQPAVDEVASFDLEVEPVASSAESEDETVATEASHDLDHDSEPIVSGHSTSGPAAAVGEARDADEFDEEIVIDHYSAIAEPQSTGIIWNLVGSRRHEVAPLNAGHDGSDEVNGHEASEETSAGAQVSVTGSEQSHEMPHQPMPEADSEIELPEVGDHAAEETYAVAETVDVPDSDTADVKEPSEETIARSDVADEIDSQTGALEFGAVADASEEVGAERADDVMGLQPDSRIDAIVPLLNELGGGDGRAERPDVRDRSMLDIESELVQTVSHGQPELEDEIGAAILDMCLDTQAQIHGALDSVDAEVSGGDQFDPALVDDRTDDDLDVNPGHDAFDVVQPEKPVTASFRIDPVTSLCNDERQSHVDDTSTATQPRPFGRLFSELRRRQRSVG